jgi:hypothetical protein
VFSTNGDNKQSDIYRFLMFMLWIDELDKLTGSDCSAWAMVTLRGPAALPFPGTNEDVEGGKSTASSLYSTAWARAKITCESVMMTDKAIRKRPADASHAHAPCQQ